jgi:hypothetical protein
MTIDELKSQIDEIKGREKYQTKTHGVIRAHRGR